MMETMNKERDLLSAEEAASYLGVRVTTVYQWCKEGRLPALKVGKVWRIRRHAFEDFLASSEWRPRQKSELTTLLDDPTEALQTLNTVAEACPLPLVVVDMEGIVEIWNAGAQRLFGWTREEVIGKVTPFVPEDLWEESDGMLPDLLERKTFQDLVLRGRRRKDGSRVDLQLSGAILFDAKDQPRALAGFYNEFTRGT